MPTFKIKSCEICKAEYQATGPAAKYCKPCRAIRDKETQLSGREAWRERNGLVRVGRGVKTGQGKENLNYKDGLTIFRKWARERRDELGHCERCKTDIRGLGKGGWDGHHKDWDRTNNIIENLEVLCRRCHHLEHGKVKNLYATSAS